MYIKLTLNYNKGENYEKTLFDIYACTTMRSSAINYYKC